MTFCSFGSRTLSRSLGRNRSGALGLLTATGSILLGSTVPASAYPGHYSRRWLLEESRSPGYTVGTCSDDPRASGELSRSHCSFCVTIGTALSAGFNGSEDQSPVYTLAPILCHFGSGSGTRVSLFLVSTVQISVCFRCP